jgi:hypothetical protein
MQSFARHYRELADRDERTDKAKMAERLELLKLARREAAGSCSLQSAAPRLS